MEFSAKNKDFSAKSLISRLEPALRNRLNITVVPIVGSTNTELKNIAENGGEEGQVLIALEQTAGRGRLGRSFYSPKDTGLYMSVLLRPKMSSKDALHITTSAAVAAAEAIDSVADVNTVIKWVNDIYLDGKKVVGILTEASVDYKNAGLNYGILGIGMNINTADFPDELKDTAASVSAKGEDLRCEIAAQFLNRFFAYYENLTDKPYLSEYRRRSMLDGMDISFIRGNDSFNGRVIGIDDELRLVVQLENGETEAFSSGEVQLKKGGLIK